MTTIAYRAGVIASDSYASTSQYLWYEMLKIARHESGALIGVAGLTTWCDKFLKAFLEADRKDLTRLPEVCKLRGTGEALVVVRRGAIYLVERGSQLRIKDTYYSIGSGSGAALAAMDAGASAPQAVKIAIKRDPYSAGRVQRLEHGG